MPLQEVRRLHPTVRRLVGAEATLPHEPPRILEGLARGLAVRRPPPLLPAAHRVRRALVSIAGACA